MISSRRCSRTGCSKPACATLTYAYADSTAVLGPLALQAEPGSYDLCAEHARGLSVPRGWDVIRLPHDQRLAPAEDDLLALANAVREVGLTYDSTLPTEPVHPAGVVELGRRGHLSLVTDDDNVRR